MALSELLENKPVDLHVDANPGEIVVHTTMSNGPGTYVQNTMSVFGICCVLFGIAVGTAGGLVGAESTTALPAAVILAIGFVLGLVSYRQRSGGPLTIRANTLIATHHRVSLSQIQSVDVVTTPIENTERHSHKLLLKGDGVLCAWNMPEVCDTQADWIANVVRTASAHAQQHFGTAREIPRTLTEIQSRPQQAQSQTSSTNE